MFKIAQQKVPESKLHLGDITAFNLHESYDVVICIYDTINHLTSSDQWRLVFENAKNHLSDNGLFIFDINTSGRLEMLAKEPPCYQGGWRPRNGDASP